MSEPRGFLETVRILVSHCKVWCTTAYLVLATRLRALGAGALRDLDAARVGAGLRGLETDLFATGLRDFDALRAVGRREVDGFRTLDLLRDAVRPRGLLLLRARDLEPADWDWRVGGGGGLGQTNFSQIPPILYSLSLVSFLGQQ